MYIHTHPREINTSHTMTKSDKNKNKNNKGVVSTYYYIQKRCKYVWA